MRTRRPSTVEFVRSPSELVVAFRERGLKVTPQRQLLFRLLHNNDQHPTADALFARASDEMPGISLRTVYQTLTDLTAMGELRAVDLGGNATHFDPNVDEHHHTVCDSCGQITDVYLPRQRLLADDFDGFSPESVAVVYHGRCQRCTSDPGPSGRRATNQPTPEPIRGG